MLSTDDGGVATQDIRKAQVSFEIRIDLSCDVGRRSGETFRDPLSHSARDKVSWRSPSEDETLGKADAPRTDAQSRGMRVAGRITKKDEV